MKPVAIVTGGVRRLGKDISFSLLESGYKLIAFYNSSNEEVLNKFNSIADSISTDYELLKCNLESVSEIRNCFTYIEEKYKTIDLLINNAAIFERKNFFEIDEIFFDKFISINLKSVFFCSQFAAKLMLKSEINFPKKIINISSLGAFENWTSFIPYSISKTGVVKLTEQLAKKLAPKILVNSIAPGIIIIENDENENVNPEEVKKYPMKRFGHSKDIIDLINFLTLKNNFITGQTIKVDGGRNL